MKKRSFAFFSACVLAALFALFGTLAACLSIRERLADFMTLPLAVLLFAVFWFAAVRLKPFFSGLPPALLLILALAAAVSVRLVWLTLMKTQPVSDFNRFYITAGELLRGRVFMPGYVAIFPHTLGYPAVLSVVFRLFGVSVAAAQGFNVFLSAVVVCLLFMIGKRMKDQVSGFYSALLWAFFPSQILFSSFVSTELLFLTLMLGCILLYLELISASGQAIGVQLLLWSTLGVLIGLCSAVRPMWPILTTGFALHYAVFAPPAAWESGKRRAAFKAAACAAMLACCLLVNSGVYAAVETAVGQPIARTGAGWNLYVGMNMRAVGQYSHEDERQFSQALRSGMTANELQEYFSGEGKKRAMDNIKSGRMGEFMMVKFSRLWSVDDNALYWIRQSQIKNLPSRINPEEHKDKMTLFLNIWYYFVLIAGVTGIIMSARRRNYAPMLYVIFLCGFVLLFLLVEANGRYHFPADALLCLLAPAALCASDRVGTNA